MGWRGGHGEVLDRRKSPSGHPWLLGVDRTTGSSWDALRAALVASARQGAWARSGSLTKAVGCCRTPRRTGVEHCPYDTPSGPDVTHATPGFVAEPRQD